ncbi:MAG TPA: hypothetical protein VFQ12_11770 [Thermoleophilaceae bacterium]|nr:hypothetical protein [Thermoleophilaceae bacterium]
MARRKHSSLEPDFTAQEEAYWEWRRTTLARSLLAVPAGKDPSRATGPLGRARDELAAVDRASEGLPPLERAAAVEEFLETAGLLDRAERLVNHLFYARSGWAPEDDFSVMGPYALPPQVVAEQRSRWRTELHPTGRKP